MTTSPSKKNRTSQACNACRQRKSRCGGERPRCKTCETLDRVCTYHDRVRKRGLQSGYVRSLEALLGLAFLHFPRCDKKLRSLLRSESLSNNTHSQKQLHASVQRWRRSGCARHLGDSSTITPQDSIDVDESSASESENVAEHFEADDSEEDQIINDDAQAPDQESHLLEIAAPAIQQPPIIVPADFLERDLPPMMSQIVNFYIEQVHCWFPVIKRGDILKSMHTNLTKESTIRDRGMRLCLWAIIALVSAHQAFTYTQIGTTEVCEQIRSALLRNESDFELGHVQANLVLILLYVALDQVELAWISSAQASRMMAIRIIHGLDDHDRRARAVRGCIFLDYVLSGYLDRTPCWSQKDLTVLEQTLDLDSTDEWQPWEAPSYDGVAKNVQPLRALSNLESIMDMISIIGRSSGSYITQELHDWQVLLPSSSKTSTATIISPAAFNLHLTYGLLICQVGDVSDPLQTEILQAAVVATYNHLEALSNALKSKMAMPLGSLFASYATRTIERWATAGLHIADTDQANAYHSLIGKTKAVWGNSATPEISSSIENLDHGERILTLYNITDDRFRVTNVLSTTDFTSQNRHNFLVQRDSTITQLGHGSGAQDSIGAAQFLEDLSPLLSMPRSGQTPTFGQNLGFVGDDFEQNWYDFLQTSGHAGNAG